MFGLFGGSKPIKVTDKPFSAFTGGSHFASMSLPDPMKLGVTANLRGVLYLKGAQEIAVVQNQAVIGTNYELQIDRLTGNLTDKIERTLS